MLKQGERKKNNNDRNENEFNHFDFGLMKNSSLSIRNALFDISPNCK